MELHCTPRSTGAGSAASGDTFMQLRTTREGGVGALTSPLLSPVSRVSWRFYMQSSSMLELWARVGGEHGPSRPSKALHATVCTARTINALQAPRQDKCEIPWLNRSPLSAPLRRISLLYPLPP